MGVRGWAISELPPAVRVWPAVVGLMFFIWLELVAVAGNGTLTVVLVGYTVLSVALMAQFGRDEWRPRERRSRSGSGRSTGWRLRRRPGARTAEARASTRGRGPGAVDATASSAARSPAACSMRRGRSPAWRSWRRRRVDHLRRPVADRRVRDRVRRTRRSCKDRAPARVAVGDRAAPRWSSAGQVSSGAIGAGLMPIAVGYLVAHYLTYLLIDGQWIVVAVSDPLQTGSDLFGTAFFRRPLPAGRPRLDDPAGGRRGRPHARRVGGPRDRPARHRGARRGQAAARPAPSQAPRHGRACPTSGGARSRWPW